MSGLGLNEANLATPGRAGMADANRLRVVLRGPSPQPQYRDLVSGAYQLPWTYLHAIKDYVDMAAHLEALPRARAVVNFAPLLLEQIDDYARQVEGFLTNSLPIRDSLLAALVSPALPPSDEQRMTLIKACLRANESRVIGRFAASGGDALPEQPVSRRSPRVVSPRLAR